MSLIRNIFLTFLVLALSAVITGYYMTSRQPSAYANPEVNPAIIAYLAASLDQDWDRLLPLLQGEALINARANIGESPGGSAGGSLADTRLVARSVAGQYEIAEVVAVTAAFTPHGDEHNIAAYRFYLHGGKIFKVERTALPLDESGLAVSGRLAEATVSEYLELIEKNEWDKALRLLVGEARRAGLAAVAQMPDMDLSFDGLELATIGENENTSLVEARYTAGGTPMKMLFTLKNVGGTWLIERVIAVE